MSWDELLEHPRKKLTASRAARPASTVCWILANLSASLFSVIGSTLTAFLHWEWVDSSWVLQALWDPLTASLKTSMIWCLSRWVPIKFMKRVPSTPLCHDQRIRHVHRHCRQTYQFISSLWSSGPPQEVPCQSKLLSWSRLFIFAHP